MLTIPRIFKDEKEEYITIPAIKHFAKNHNLKYEGAAKRDGLDCIFAFGNSSAQNEEIVLSWIDDIILEGIKDVYVSYFPLDQKTKQLLSNQATADTHFAHFVTDNTKPNLCLNQYGKDFSLVSIRWCEEDRSRRIIFTYCRKLFVSDSNNEESSIKPIDYPVTAEYYVEEELLAVMAKPRTNLYEYRSDKLSHDDAAPTNADKEISSATRLIERILGKANVIRKTEESKLKNKLFYLIDKYTKTPAEIKNVIALNTSQLDIITEAIMDICNTQKECNSPSSDDVSKDINNIVEKYLSIHWKNNKVFTQDRETFPIKLNATDEEESMVEQTASSFQPLQTKSIFFDNKKMLEKNKSCNGAFFSWKRRCSTYCTPRFPVSINIKKGICIFKFTQYTMKEDIENVIFSVIEANGETDEH